MWFKGFGKIDDPVLAAFIELWDSCTPGQRAAFLNRHAQHLDHWEVSAYIERSAVKLPKGVLIALTALFEGEMREEE